MKRIPIWIDCDTGVDDALALLVAQRLEALEILGVSTVSGNVHLNVSTDNTLKVLQLAGANCPVYRGAEKPLFRDYVDASEFHGPDGLGGAAIAPAKRIPEELPMWDALYQTAKAQQGALTVVTIGPMTNLATALEKYPDLPDYIKQVVFMGGATVGGNCTAYAEFNIYADPEAAQLVCKSGIPLVMCPLDVTHQAYLTEADLTELAAAGTPVTGFIYESSAHLLSKNLEAGLPGIAQHDVCPLLYLAYPEIFGGERSGVRVEICDTVTLGRTVTDLNGEEVFEKKNALVLLHLDRAAFVRRVKEALLSY